MSFSGGLIRKPVGVTDVQQALSTASGDVGVLCTSGNINKWAKYKPVRFNKVGILTETERMSVKYGLVPYENKLAESVTNISTSSHPTEDNFDAARNDAREWSYNRPRGSNYNEPYRLVDFVESPNAGEGGGSGGSTTNSGYYVQTQPPLSFGTKWEIDYDMLNNLQNVSKTVGSWVQENSAYIAKIKLAGESALTDKPSVVEYTNWDATFGTASSIGNTYTIPINFLLDFTANSEDWRLGIIIFIPGGVVSTVVNNYADLVVSRHPLRQMQSTNKGDYITKFSPDFITNQVCAWRMRETCAAASGDVTFKCFPVICKVTNPGNVFTTDAAIQGNTGRTYILPTNTNTLQIYSLPTGVASFTITVTKADFTFGWKFVLIHEKYADIRTGGDITPSTPVEARGEIKRLCLLREEQSIPSSLTYQVDQVSCSYGYNTWDSTTGTRKRNYGSYTRTEAMTTAAAIVVNGVTYGYGYTIRSGYEMDFFSDVIILHT